MIRRLATATLLAASVACTMPFADYNRGRLSVESTRVGTEHLPASESAARGAPTLRVRDAHITDGLLNAEVEQARTCGITRVTTYRDVETWGTTVNAFGRRWSFLEAATYDAGMALTAPLAIVFDYAILGVGQWSRDGFESALVVGGVMGSAFLISAAINLIGHLGDDRQAIVRTRTTREPTGPTISCEIRPFSGDATLRVGAHASATTVVDGILSAPAPPGSASILLDGRHPVQLTAGPALRATVPLDPAERVEWAKARMGPLEPSDLVGRRVALTPIEAAAELDLDAEALALIHRRFETHLRGAHAAMVPPDKPGRNGPQIRLRVVLTRADTRCRATIEAQHTGGPLPYVPVELDAACDAPAEALSAWLGGRTAPAR